MPEEPYTERAGRLRLRLFRRGREDERFDLTAFGDLPPGHCADHARHLRGAMAVRAPRPGRKVSLPPERALDSIAGDLSLMAFGLLVAVPSRRPGCMLDVDLSHLPAGFRIAIPHYRRHPEWHVGKLNFRAAGRQARTAFRAGSDGQNPSDRVTGWPAERASADRRSLGLFGVHQARTTAMEPTAVVILAKLFQTDAAMATCG